VIMIRWLIIVALHAIQCLLFVVLAHRDLAHEYDLVNSAAAAQLLTLHRLCESLEVCVLHLFYYI
jgi:hypothetical protein